ncbi:GNAT family N-acetyltransferase [Asanoa sp. WMMD1127]|uniref:GNAT family N-acetyltransferase n=1 Tax=Asanoa sp. WMMD1127 TaxID=3016107 RepID=UPI002415C278|nr:GNAT family N-acetyltransferase [Asanoa sp. WMMD1127]MDG4821836.1 GNAT family N-acetyltransferase [Asanoa sp. WMMD1127]
MRAIERVLGAERAAFYRLRLDRRGVVLTAWASDHLVGAVYVTWEPADEDVVRQHLPDVPFLHRLYVLPPLRNKGRGTALLGAAEALAEVRAAGRLAAGIDPRNVRVVGLYERLGYREWPHGLVETVQEHYAPDGEVATEPDVCRIFVKDLDPA